MIVAKKGNNITVTGDNYTLEYNSKQDMYVTLLFNNNIGGELFVPSGCDRDEFIDEVITLNLPEVRESSGMIELVFTGKTTLWEKVEYTFKCFKDKALYSYRVYGNGSLDNARFFEGFLKDDPCMEKKLVPAYTGEGRKTAWHRPVKDFMYSSAPRFQVVFSSQINSADKRFFMYYEDVTIQLNGWIYNYGGDCFVTPPPFFYMIGPKSKDSWVSMGLVVKPGENNFMSYEYSGGEGFGLNLTYDGFTKISGSWQSPEILFEMSDGIYKGLKNYVCYLRDNGFAKVKDRSNIPGWWKEPIFGGWGEQCYHSTSWEDYFKSSRKGRSGSSSENCTRKAYEIMLAQLEKRDINPTILIVDNRWFRKDYCLDIDEALWPDMKGFVSEQHAKGRKVILWVSPFDYQRSSSGKDVPVSEHMVLNKDNSYTLVIDTDVFYKELNLEKRKSIEPPKYEYGQMKREFVVDPLNPDYEKRIREKVQFLLSPEGLDADGFEFDYLHRLPSRKGFIPVIPREETPWGVELLHRTLWIYYDQAKKAKPDALIISHTFNPYFDDIVDMLRLNDFYTDNRSVVEQMHHRARIARISCPGCCVHTDQHPMPNLAAWREYARFQPLIGNPVLYYVTGMETTKEKFTDEDWGMLREIWSQYREKMDTVYAPKT